MCLESYVPGSGPRERQEGGQSRVVREEFGLGEWVMGSECLPLLPTVCYEGPLGRQLGPRTGTGSIPTMAPTELSQSALFRHGSSLSFC